MIQIFTITARNYLSLALTLGDSVSQHHPEARFCICVADGLEGIDPSSLRHALLDVPALLGAALIDDLAFKYNITEYCTSIKPALFRHFFEADERTDFVYYLDPDTLLLQRLDPVDRTSPERTLYLAPHLLDCHVSDDHAYPEYRHLWEGIFNLGFCGVRRTAVMPKLLDWWDRRLREYCYADFFDGLHTDQKWMDYAPAYFRHDLVVVEQRGVNVAHWNLAERDVGLRDGRYWTGDEPLILFHFSGFDFSGRHLTKHVPAERQQYFTGAVADLARRYRQAVLDNGYEHYIGIPYAFATYRDGRPVTALHRRLYRAKTAQEPVTQPFDSAGEFRQSLESAGLMDDSGAALRNHSAATLPQAGRLSRIAERLMRLFLRVAGPARYVYLTKMFSRYGRPESHLFLLRKDRQ